MTGLFLVSILRSAVAIALVFVVCIVIHEFGHFIVAKRCGVAVPTFAIGFGPKLLKWNYHGTEYSVRLFPIGGFVQLAGEIPQDALFRVGEEISVQFNDDHEIAVVGSEEDVPGGITGKLVSLDLMNRMEMTLDTAGTVETFRVMPHAKLMTSKHRSMPLVEKREQVAGKPLWQRALIILAGPGMNFLLAGVLFSGFYMNTGMPSNTSTLGAIIPNSAAAQAGLKAGDHVLSVNGRDVGTWYQLVAEIQSDVSHPPAPLRLMIQRGPEVRQVTVVPRMTSQGTPLLGVNNALSYNKLEALTGGFRSVYYGTVNSLQLYGQVFVHHQMSNLAGPVGIADVISQQAKSGIWQVVMIAGLLSLNLGLFNLLPIPALDGGRLSFMVLEMVRGKSVDPRKEGLVHFVGFALLMLFAVVITYRDVTRLF